MEDIGTTTLIQLMAKLTERKKRSISPSLKRGCDSTDNGSAYEESDLTILDDAKAGRAVPSKIVHVRFQFQFESAKSNGTYPPPWLVPK